MDKKINKYAFAALAPYVQTNIVENVAKEIAGKDFYAWGTDNKYPDFLYDLFKSVAVFQSIVNGTADFICGNDITLNTPQGGKIVNKNDETIEDIVRKLTIDFMIFGGFALQVIRNANGQVAELYYVDFLKIRTDKKNEVIFYSEDWSKSYGRVKYIAYPKFKKGDQNATSIFYYKNEGSRDVYPTPIYNGAITDLVIQKKIGEFHLNEISNNFLSSKVINFNNGVPDDELKNEIEQSINEKFTGAENAGRILISFSDSKENETTVSELATDSFADRYGALSKRTSQQIFTAFRSTPNLFGLPTETTGFNSQEYAESFKLYNRTVVRPIQKKLVDVFDKIFDMEGAITIEPYSIENNTTEKEVE